MFVIPALRGEVGLTALSLKPAWLQNDGLKKNFFFKVTGKLKTTWFTAKWMSCFRVDELKGIHTGRLGTLFSYT